MMLIVRHFILPLLLTMLLAVPGRALFAEESRPISDIRILIDISGSMKWTDPDNLRRPGLRMLAGLLPADSRAGVWTFATQVNMLVPWRDVTDDWRELARKQSYKIDSPGLFTNIEAVLETAIMNQTAPDPRFRRSMILLSDGMVDISKDETKNRQSRQRVLQQLAPQLKQAGIVVHTIALSEEADHELLRDLSLITDGWYHQVDTAEELQRVFLLLFEKAAQRDSVPLTDNHFSIDPSVSEMTVLAFRQQGADAATLVMPDQSRLQHDTSRAGVRWQHEAEFDLITIKQPAAGHWYIDAQIDPDNRVMVLTDMQLRTTDLPNNMLIGERFDFSANLTEKGEIIRRQDFLQLVDANLLQSHELGEFLDTELNSSQQDGLYQRELGNFFQPGLNDVVVSMKSATFERERRQKVNVVALPLNIEVSQLPERQTRTHRLNLQVDTEWLSTDDLNIRALLGAEDGSEWPYDVARVAADQWQLTLADLDPGVKYTVQLQLRGSTPEGRTVFLQPAAVMLDDADFETQLIQPYADLIPPADEPAPTTPEITELPVIAESQPAADSESDNAFTLALIQLAIGNLLILLLLAAGFWRWRHYQRHYVPAGEML